MKKILLTLFLLSACTPDTRYTLREDNDLFSPITNLDAEYTQGAEFVVETPDKSGSTAYSLQQLLYTPAQKQLTTYQPYDRPYAALLAGNVSFKYRQDYFTEDTLKFTAGIVGPHAYGEQAQNGVHKLIGDNYALGWRNQIHDEPALMLTGERRYATPLNQYSDIVSTVGANLGNVFTQGYCGLSGRIGYNLPDFFSSGGIIYPRVDKPIGTNAPKWSAYVFGGPYVRGVLQNIFLDGNTFQDSARIPKKTFVAEGRLGFGAEYDKYRLEYTYIVQTAEFKGQPDGNDFGEVNLSVIW